MPDVVLTVTLTGSQTGNDLTRLLTGANVDLTTRGPRIGNTVQVSVSADTAAAARQCLNGAGIQFEEVSR